MCEKIVNVQAEKDKKNEVKVYIFMNIQLLKAFTR